MGSENLYRCFQGKLKDLLLGGMVNEKPLDRGPVFSHSGSNCLKDGLLAVEFLLDLEEDPKANIPFSLQSWIVRVEEMLKLELFKGDF